jgi:hypothetical protein
MEKLPGRTAPGSYDKIANSEVSRSADDKARLLFTTIEAYITDWLFEFGELLDGQDLGEYQGTREICTLFNDFFDFKADSYQSISNFLSRD